MNKRLKVMALILFALFSLAACNNNGIIGNEQQSSTVEATEQNMLTIGRGIINNLGSVYTVETQEEAEEIIRRNIVAEDVYYQGFLNFFKDDGEYEDVSIKYSNEKVTNLNQNNTKMIGTILYEFDIEINGIKADGSRELIGQADNLAVQIANYEGHFRMIEIKRR